MLFSLRFDNRLIAARENMFQNVTERCTRFHELNSDAADADHWPCRRATDRGVFITASGPGHCFKREAALQWSLRTGAYSPQPCFRFHLITREIAPSLPHHGQPRLQQGDFRVDNSSTIQAIISNDPVRRRLLETVRLLNLPDCWIGAGFVRNAVWDHLHRRGSSPVSTDVDVIWFDREHCAQAQDEALEALLRGLDPNVRWSVKNQARMHVRNGDDPYHSATDAMRYWPETATAVAVRLLENGTCEVAAPLGLDDLFDLIIRPAGRFASEKNAIYQARVKSRNWLKDWPMLTFLKTPTSLRSSR